MPDAIKFLDELEALANAATPGPWHSAWDDDPLFMSSYFVATKDNASPWDETHPSVIAATLLQTKTTIGHENEKWEENADFIAAADPEAVKRLVGMVRILANGCDCDADTCMYNGCTPECRLKMAYQRTAIEP